MSHHIYRVEEVSVCGPGQLWLRFDDGLERKIDLTGLMRGELFGPLTQSAEFARVTVDAECGIVTWPCGADLDPGVLHEWPSEGPAMLALAATW